MNVESPKPREKEEYQILYSFLKVFLKYSGSLCNEFVLNKVSVVRTPYDKFPLRFEYNHVKNMSFFHV